MKMITGGAMIALALSFGMATAAPLEKVAPSEVNLSEDQLNRLSEKLRADIEAGIIPGATVLILRDGKIGYLEAFGMRDKEAGVAMTEDSIFRIYSMTKPITSVVAMQLVEEGRLALEAPVARYIPAFANTMVGTESDGETVETRKPARPVLVHDLLRHTSGITYGVFGNSAIKGMYREAGVGSGQMSATDEAKTIAGLPLIMDPGSGWDYGRSTDVLGAVIEAVEGQPLSQVFKTRVFDPLGMKDTAFYVENEADRDRVAQPQVNPQTGQRPPLIDPATKPTYESGGGGLFSTTRDYGRFLAALLNDGELDGARILSPQSIEYMTSDHLGPILRGQPEGVRSIGYLPGPGYTFGLGFAVRESNGVSPRPGNAGDYQWGGYAGTAFWVDPSEDLAVVFMMQSPAMRVPYRILMRNMVYPAVMPMQSATN